jgi:opacity protein-like surface antigen
LRSLLALSTFAVVALAASPARADWVWVNRYQNPYVRPHFYLGAEGVGVFTFHQTDHQFLTAGGGGFNVFIGGRLNRWAGIELGWQPTFHNQLYSQSTDQPNGRYLALQALTLDLKVYLARGPVQPYVMGGAGLYMLSDNFNVLTLGPGWQVGGGLDFWLGTHVTLGLRVQYRGVDVQDGFDTAAPRTYLSMLTGGLDLTGHF